MGLLGRVERHVAQLTVQRFAQFLQAAVGVVHAQRGALLLEVLAGGGRVPRQGPRGGGAARGGGGGGGAEVWGLRVNLALGSLYRRVPQRSPGSGGEGLLGSCSTLILIGQSVRAHNACVLLVIMCVFVCASVFMNWLLSVYIITVGSGESSRLRQDLPQVFS